MKAEVQVKSGKYKNPKQNGKDISDYLFSHSLFNMAEFAGNIEVEIYDHLVVGLGGHGSATLASLAKSNPGAKILGLERFDPAHGWGKLS